MYTYFKCILILLIALFVSSGCSGSNDKTNNIYLLPKGYEGNVYVFFNVEGAPSLEKEKDYSVFDINHEGYYATSASDMEYGTVNDKYFYVDSDGRRTKINKTCVRTMGTGSTEFSTPNNEHAYEILYTGIEVRLKECSLEFETSENGIKNDDLNKIFKKVVNEYNIPFP